MTDYSAYIFDLDGVIYNGNEVIDGVLETITSLYSSGKKIFFFTNNSTLSPFDYSSKLYGMNIKCQPEQIFTSSVICAMKLQEIHPNICGLRAFIIGEKGLIEAIESIGISIINKQYTNDEIIKNRSLTTDFVIAGLDRDITYKKLSAAVSLINRGAIYYASNSDASLPTEFGFLPGAGSIQSLITTASGKSPEKIFGKPDPEGIYQILKKYHIRKDSAVFVGDRIDTDIMCAVNAGISSVLVLTGVSQEHDVDKLPLEHRPSLVIKNLTELLMS